MTTKMRYAAADSARSTRSRARIDMPWPRLPVDASTPGTVMLRDGRRAGRRSCRTSRARPPGKNPLSARSGVEREAAVPLAQDRTGRARTIAGCFGSIAQHVVVEHAQDLDERERGADVAALPPSSVRMIGPAQRQRAIVELGRVAGGSFMSVADGRVRHASVGRGETAGQRQLRACRVPAVGRHSAISPARSVRAGNRSSRISAHLQAEQRIYEPRAVREAIGSPRQRAAARAARKRRFSGSCERHPRMQQIIDNRLRGIVPAEVLEVDERQRAVGPADGVVKAEIRRAQRPRIAGDDAARRRRPASLRCDISTPARTSAMTCERNVEPSRQRIAGLRSPAGATRRSRSSRRSTLADDVGDRKTRFRRGRRSVTSPVRRASRFSAARKPTDASMSVSADRAGDRPLAVDVLVDGAVSIAIDGNRTGPGRTPFCHKLQAAEFGAETVARIVAGSRR